MRREESERILRLYTVVDAVPFPRQGAQDDGAGYILDMREFLPALKKALYSIVCASVPGMVADIDYDNPDRLMDTMKRWVDTRQAQQWSGQPALLRYEPDDAEGEEE